MATDYTDILQQRIRKRQDGPLHAEVLLRHLSLINYAVPKERLIRHIPEDRFEIPEFMFGGEPMTLMSAVVFYDRNFHYVHVIPSLKDGFGQTNYRVYVKDRLTDEHCAWFFGTTLGSPLVYCISGLWGIPWYWGHYKIDCLYNHEKAQYERYLFDVRSSWSASHVEIEDTGMPMDVQSGFASREELALIVTHPVEGYFYRKDGKLGTYSVWHREISMTLGTAHSLYFSLYERLGLLTREEMQRPHSIFLCPETELRIHLPPNLVKTRV